MKPAILFSIIFFIFLAACTVQKPVACESDKKICPDGSAVGRIPPNCEFAPCLNPPRACNYEDDSKKYVGKSADECSRIKFMCEPGTEYFEGDCGCGCAIIEPDKKQTAEQNYCKDEQRNADACTQLYDPVCGWFDPEKIQCVRYPCASTYSNSCFACQNPDVLYWTAGKCPE